MILKEVRQMKRIVAWLLMAVLLLGAAGCGPRGEEPLASSAVEFAKDDFSEILSKEPQEPKNIILMIADGMGPNDILLCERYFKKDLLLSSFPYHGMVATNSASHAITDSAAAATALATGVKTANGMVGQAPAGDPLSNLCEIARAEGKKIGIVTNDLATGATPSSFMVHHKSRKDTKILARKIVDFGPDLLVARDFKGFHGALDQERRRLLSEYSVSKKAATAKAAMARAEKIPCFCFSDAFRLDKADDLLAQYTKEALAFLENEEGFFLMIESCGTDKRGHENDIEGKIQSVETFDRAVGAVLSFMKDHPDTLLLVTSDHETGGVRLPKEGEKLSDKLFSSKKHTAAPVRVFALGKGASYFHERTVDNTEIANFAIKAVKGDF